MKRSVFTALAASVLVAFSLGFLSVPAEAEGVYSTTTSLSVAPSSVTYGQETATVFTATVTAQDASDPGAGTVTVTSGSTTLCSFDLTTLDFGTGSCSPSSDTLLAASDNPYSAITASYAENGLYKESLASAPVSLTVNQQATTTTLSFTGSPLVYGQESTLTFDSSVTPTISGLPTGTIAVAAGTTPLCTITLPDPSCSTIDDLLSATGGPYAITATYSGDANYVGSTSSPQDLAVSQATTTTTLDLSPPSVTFGDESTLVVTATVSPQFTGTPTGTIVVTADTNPLCSIVLPATTCSPPESAVPVQGSAYTVSASYPGDANFSRSTSSPAQTLTVAKASTTTTLTISSPTVTYGNEDSLIFTATVSPAFAGTPTGTVNVLAGSTQLCSITLPATQCMTTDDPLEASGTANAVTANYVGDANFVGSPSSTKNLTVDQVSTTTSLNVSPSTIPFGSESTVTFTATVSPQSAGSDATGVITVATPSTTLCTIDLSSAASCSTSQTALGAGAYTITATYSGNTNFTSSSSTQGLTVNQATPSPPGIANLPSGAAEEGSFVASVATSGDGSRSVVSQTTGTCTVGSDGVTVSFLVAGACTLTPQVSSGHNFIGATGSPETFSIAFGPRGYWLVGSDGGIFSFGSAQFYGSMGATPLQRPVVGITPTHDKRGYWLVASDGGIFSFGDSNFYGSIPALGLHPAGSGLPNSLGAPIVGMVPSSDGNGYFMVASDGGVFAFGDARFAGSCPGIGGCAGSAVAVMPDHSGNGYWLVTSTGDIYAFGDAPFFGSPSPQPSPVVNAVATPDGHGYWILYANGAVVSFGDAPALGAPVGYVNGFNPATSIFPTTDGLGYWVASAHGDVFSYGNAPFLGSMSATPLNGPIIAAFGF